MVSVGDVEMWLENYLPHLEITQGGTWIIIRLKHYLGEGFPKLAAIVRQHGGEYISAGKESHFRVSTAGQIDAPKQAVTLEGLVYCAYCGKANKVKLEKA